MLHPNPDVIVFNIKQRYTGVSATINALVPLQMAQWRLGYCGTTLSNGVVGMTAGQAMALSRQPPPGRAFRIWHGRRDPEMMLVLLTPFLVLSLFRLTNSFRILLIYASLLGVSCGEVLSFHLHLKFLDLRLSKI